MRFLTVAIALAVLGLIADDTAFLMANWGDFRHEDLIRHLQFHVSVLAAVVWYLYLTARAWHHSGYVHLKLLATFLAFLAGVVAFFIVVPAVDKGWALEGDFLLLSIALRISFFVAGAVLLVESWRLHGPQPSRRAAQERKAVFDRLP